MEYKAYFKNKARSNVVTTHSDTKRNIPKVFSFAITRLHCTHSINKRAEELFVDTKYTELRGK